MEKRMKSLLGFRWTHHIVSFKRQIPTEVKWIENGSYYVSYPFLVRHIGHFAESVNQVLLKLRYPSFYPPFTDFYLPRFARNEFEWSVTYLKLMLQLFPSNFTPTLHIAGSIPLNIDTCFRSAVAFLSLF